MQNKNLDWIFRRAIPEPNSGCWLWEWGLNSSGYGKHRKVYEALVCVVPEGLDLDHTCRVKSCVNPDHLRPMTHSKNMRVGVFARSSATHCVNGHEFTPENTLIRIYRDPVHGDRKKRGCRTCILARARESKRKIYREERGGQVGPKPGDRTHCPQGHEYTAENTGITIRPDGGRARWCRQCKREKEIARGPRVRVYAKRTKS